MNIEETGWNEREKGELLPIGLNLNFILCLNHSEGEKLCNEPLNPSSMDLVTGRARLQKGMVKKGGYHWSDFNLETKIIYSWLGYLPWNWD